MRRRVYFNELTLSGSDLQRNVSEFLSIWRFLVEAANVKNVWASAETKAKLSETLCSARPDLKRILLMILHQAIHPLFPVESESCATELELKRFSESKFALVLGSDEIDVGRSMLSWAVIRCSPSVGFAVYPYDALHLKVKECADGQDELWGSLCITKKEDFNDEAVKRWISVMNSSAIEMEGVFRTSYEQKHFKVSHLPRPQCQDWSDEPWVLATKAGAAQFRPGIQPQGTEYNEILRQVLSSAFAEGRYEADALDGFVCDIYEDEDKNAKLYIGAADGKPTSKVEMYLTDQNVVHLRPKETR